MKLKSIKLWLTIAFTGLFTYLLISKNISEDIYSNLLTIISVNENLYRIETSIYIYQMEIL